MPKVTGPLFSLEASGKLGDAIVYDRRGHVRRLGITKQARTAGQMAVTSSFRDITRNLALAGDDTKGAMRSNHGKRWFQDLTGILRRDEQSFYSAAVSVFDTFGAGAEQDWIDHAPCAITSDTPGRVFYGMVNSLFETWTAEGLNTFGLVAMGENDALKARTWWRTLALNGVGIYDNLHPAWFFSGVWSESANSHYYGGTVKVTAGVGNYAQLSFGGKSFKYVYTKNTNRGLIDVYIDGLKVTTINANGALEWQKVWNSPVLEEKAHVVKVVHAGGSTYIDVDYLQVLS